MAGWGQRHACPAQSFSIARNRQVALDGVLRPLHTQAGKTILSVLQHETTRSISSHLATGRCTCQANLKACKSKSLPAEHSRAQQRTMTPRCGHWLERCPRWPHRMHCSSSTARAAPTPMPRPPKAPSPPPPPPPIAFRPPPPPPPAYMGAEWCGGGCCPVATGHSAARWPGWPQVKHPRPPPPTPPPPPPPVACMSPLEQYCTAPMVLARMCVERTPAGRCAMRAKLCAGRQFVYGLPRATAKSWGGYE